MIGTTISHYTILEKLGEGGMGIVYRAHDTKLDRDVALKFLPTNLVLSPEEITRFELEAKTISALNHPNIATIHDIDEVNGQRYLVLEYIPGGTLQSRLKQLRSEDKEFSVGEVVNYGIQIAEALSHAHRHQIIHRDVKTDNIMLTEDGKVKLTDFGLAKILGPAHLTKTGSTLGTAAYMSPEQVRGEEIDHRSDIFSLGVVLYELATSHLPFRGEFETALSYSILNENPSGVTSVRKSVPQSLERIISRCLEKEKGKRYQNTDHIVAELKNVQVELTGKTVAIQKESKTPWMIAAGLVLLAVIGIYLFLSKPVPLVPADKSVAVLPFKNLSDSKEDEYFSDGITDDIIAQLSKISDLKVISRTSVMQYKGISKKIPEIGKELNVATVLEGSVRRAGNQIRIVAQLIDATNEGHLWADTYDKELTQVFAIQSDVAQQIAAALKAKLSSEEKKKIELRPTQNVEAYTLYLQGRFFWNKRTENGFHKAIDYFQQAIAKDSGYSRAYAGIADCYNLLGVYGSLSPKESAPRAKAAALRAIETDNTLAESHEALAHVGMLYDWDWSNVEREYKEAITLDPEYATAQQRYAIYLTMEGHINEALAGIKRAQDLDPLSLIITTDVGLIYCLKGEYLQGIEQCRKVLSLDSEFVAAYFILGIIEEQLGKSDEAIVAFQKAVQLSPGNSIYLSALGHAYAAAGKRSNAENVLNALSAISRQRYVSPYSLAIVYAGMGEKGKTLEWLEEASEDRSVWLIHLYMGADPRLRFLHADRRFNALVRSMGLGL